MIYSFKIHKEGFVSIIATSLFAMVLLGVVVLFNFSALLKFFIFIFILLLLFCVFYFFRVPYRKTNRDENAVIAPADGTIVQILEVTETEYFNDKRIQVSIFMSPLNVHVNFYPIDGEITYIKYHPGKHLIARLPKASVDNEHNTIVQKHTSGVEILFRQIAGTMARRIVSNAKKDENAIQGTEMGMIKFGSRVDVFLPLSSIVNVKLNDKVKAKITHLAYLKTNI